MNLLYFPLLRAGKKLSSVLPLLHPECHSLPEPNLLPGQLSHGAVGIHGGKVRWLSMAFESVSHSNSGASRSAHALTLMCPPDLSFHTCKPSVRFNFSFLSFPLFLNRPHTRGNPPSRPTPTSSSGKTSSRSSLPPYRSLRRCSGASRPVSTGSRSSWKS